MTDSLVHRGLAAAATAFGVATVAAGTRVALGTDPGYAVFVPLLAYNTLMGVAYGAAGLAAWRDAGRGARAAAAIAVLNGAVLGAAALLHGRQAGVAMESVRAMTLRTSVWMGLWLALSWLGRRRKRRPRATGGRSGPSGADDRPGLPADAC